MLNGARCVCGAKLVDRVWGAASASRPSHGPCGQAPMQGKLMLDPLRVWRLQQGRSLDPIELATIRVLGVDKSSAWVEGQECFVVCGFSSYIYIVTL